MPFALISILTTLASGVIALGLAGYVLHCNRRARANVWLAAGLACIGVHEACLFVSRLGSSAVWHLAWLQAAVGTAALLVPIWVKFTLVCGQSNGTRRDKPWEPAVVGTAVMAGCVCAILALGHGLSYLPLGTSGYAAVTLDDWGKLIFSIYLLGVVAVLLYTENLYRGARGVNRQQIRSLVLGIFLAFTCQVVVTGYTLLFPFIHPSYAFVSSAGFLGGQALIAWALARHRLLDTDIYVSRYVVYRSLTLAIVGGYLFSLGLVAELFRRLEIHLDFLTGTLLAIVGGAGLAFLLMSENVRWRTKMFVQAHFYRHKYDYREEWMEFTRHLSEATTRSAVSARTAERILTAMWVRQVAVYAMDEDAKTLTLLHQLGYEQLPATVALSDDAAAILSRAGLPSEGRTGDTAESGQQFMRGLLPGVPVGHVAPLVALDTLVGLLVVGPEVSGKPFGPDDTDLLAAVAAQTGAMLVNARLSQEAAQGRELQVLAKVSAFIAHDLKNMVSMLSLLAENAKQYMHDPEFQADAIKTVADVTARMQKLLQNMSAPVAQVEAAMEPVVLAESVQGWVNELGRQVPSRIRLQVECRGHASVRVNAGQLQSVVRNLVLNAVEAIPETGTITISTADADGSAVLTVTDTGRGMTAEFMEKKLFRPFQTTKSRGLGIGLFQCRQVVRTFGGTLTAESREGEGTRMMVRLPACAAQQAAVGSRH